ncbi:class I SAM-dependent methyltransferase [soil metagenome]
MSASSWTRYSAEHPDSELDSTLVAAYGSDIADESRLRLAGNVEGKRVLHLGCGAGHASVAFARQGARVVGVDPSADQIAHARRNAEEAEVRVELHQADVADLAFIGADGIDVAFSAYGLAGVADLDRVFRSVHRLLKPEAPFVFSLPHPAFTMLDPTADQPLLVRRAYTDRAPLRRGRGARAHTDQPRTISDTFTSLLRANFRVDTLLEPEPDLDPEAPRSAHWHDAMAMVPPTVIFRGRKLGI